MKWLGWESAAPSLKLYWKLWSVPIGMGLSCRNWGSSSISNFWSDTTQDCQVDWRSALMQALLWWWGSWAWRPMLLILAPTLTYGHELWVVTKRIRLWVQMDEIGVLSMVAGLIISWEDKELRYPEEGQLSSSTGAMPFQQPIIPKFFPKNVQKSEAHRYLLCRYLIGASRHDLPYI